jgi:hypothetical protein
MDMTRLQRRRWTDEDEAKEQAKNTRRPVSLPNLAEQLLRSARRPINWTSRCGWIGVNDGQSILEPQD